MLTTDSIEACNTGLNCTTDNIATGTSICSSCQYDQPTCGTLAKSTSGSTWGSFISSLSLTQGQFEACNPLATVDISGVMPSNRYYCSVCLICLGSSCFESMLMFHFRTVNTSLLLTVQPTIQSHLVIHVQAL
jgi:hypothetical protein